MDQPIPDLAALATSIGQLRDWFFQAEPEVIVAALVDDPTLLDSLRIALLLDCDA